MKSKMTKKSKIITLSMLFIVIIFSVIFAVGATEDTSEAYYKVVYTDVDSYREDLDNLTAPKYTEFPEYFESGEWLFAGWFTDADCTKPLGKTTQTGQAHAKFVPADILGVKAQVNYELYDSYTTNDETGAIRFVTSVDSLDYAEVGFIFDRGKGYEEPQSSTSVYRTLYVTVGETDVNGEKTEEFNPKELFDESSEFFKTWTYVSVPSSAYITEIKVTPFWITLDGTTVKAEQGMKTVNQGRSWEYVYVDESGSDDTGVGTSGKPYATLNKALSEMKANYKAPYIESYSLDTTEDTEGKDGIVCIKDSLNVESGFSWDDHDMDVIITSDVADISKLDISNITTVVDASTLDFSKISAVEIGDSVTFANMTLNFYGSKAEDTGTVSAGSVYANGNRLKITSSVTSDNPYTLIYGGGNGTGNDVSKTDVTILAGNYYAIYGGGRLSNVSGNTNVTLKNTNVFYSTGGVARVHGGGNKGNVGGDTHVTIGEGFNSSAEFDYTSHSKLSAVWGGGYSAGDGVVSTVEGDTYVTVTGNAKTNYVFGGGHANSEVKGTCHVIFENGYAFSIYGGTSSSSGMNSDTSVVMNGGEVEQVFGGNEATGMTGNTYVQISGGTVSRRIYGGCYNGSSSTTNHVDGYTMVSIDNDAELLQNSYEDDSIVAISRSFTSAFDNERGVFIFNDYETNSNVSKTGTKHTHGSIISQTYNHFVRATSGGTVSGVGNRLCIEPDNGKVATVRVGTTDGDIIFYTESKGLCALSELSATDQQDIYVVFDDTKPDDVNLDDCEAKTNGAYYNTLEEAVSVANELSEITETQEAITVTLLKDAEVDKTLTIADSANMLVQSNTGVTYTVTYSNTENNLLEVEGKLAIENLNLAGGKSGIYMNAGSEVTATDVNVTRLSATGAALVVVNEESSFTLNGTDETSSIYGNSLAGRGVEVYGTFVLNGGTIQGNTIEGDGAGVNVPEGGSFTLNGGTIQENNASACGGGVAVRGTFTMTDGTIQTNDANKGAGVILRATAKANITGGTVQSNIATEHGGGVYIQSSNANTTINGVTIKENSAVDGGGVYVNANNEVSIDTATIQNNTATANGGGIYILKTSFVLKNGTIASNNAVDGGGVYVSSGQTFTMENGTIQSNTVTSTDYSHGGGVYTAGTFTMCGGNIQNNIAATTEKSYTFGAGVYVTGEFVMNGGSISNHGDADNRSISKGAGVCVHEGGTFTMNDGSIAYNYASQAGAGVAVEAGEAGNSSFTMTGGTISNNNSSGAAGSIIVRANTSFNMEGGNINNNTASTTGGAVHALGTVAINGGTIDQNAAANGAGIYVANSATFNMNAGNITNNTATKNGGGIYTQSVNTTITDGSIENNTATGIVEDEVLTNGNGGGVYVDTNGILTMENGTIKNNTAAVNGGGICLNTTDDTKKNTFTGGVIEENDALDGGGLYINVSKDVVMNNITIRNNIATQNGGGVYVNSSRNFDMESGTITANTAVDGGGVYTYNKGKFTMTGGSIQSNTATGMGSGVCVAANSNKPFTMSGGTISGHGTTDARSSSVGAGVYVAESAVFNMTGESAVVENNYSSQTGAGVAVAGTFTMSKGTIQGNNTNISSAGGAGVHVLNAGSFTMNGGTIYNNIATYYGGGIYQEGSLTINGGEITENRATVTSEGKGGALYMTSGTAMTMAGGKIYKNYSKGNGGAIFAEDNNTITLEAGEISENTAGGNVKGVFVTDISTSNKNNASKVIINTTFVIGPTSDGVANEIRYNYLTTKEEPILKITGSDLSKYSVSNPLNIGLHSSSTGVTVRIECDSAEAAAIIKQAIDDGVIKQNNTGQKWIFSYTEGDTYITATR